MGVAVAADADAARSWYELAAAQGNAAAQTKLNALRGPRLVTEAQPVQARLGS
jgi:TPR repeat protein